jgi:mannopine transport system permease protein
MAQENPTKARIWPTTLVSTIVLAFLLLPTIIVIPVSFGREKYLTFPPKHWSLNWYAAYFSDPEWMSATKLSLLVALLATIVSTAVAVPATLAFGRGRVPGQTALRPLMIAPMILPHIIIAVALYITFSRWNIVGSIGAFVVAHSVLCLPFLFLTLSSAVSKLDPSLEMAAANLGASRWSAFRHVTLPLLTPAISGGMAFAFITSLDEAVVSIFLSSSTAKLLTKKMFEDIDFDVSPTVAAVSTLIVVVSFALIGLSQLVRIARTRKAG